MPDFPIKDLRRADIRPGDRMVLQTELRLTQEQHAALQQAWRAWTAPLVIPLLVLPLGFKLTQVRDLEAAAQKASLEVPHG